LGEGLPCSIFHGWLLIDEMLRDTAKLEITWEQIGSRPMGFDGPTSRPI